MRYNKISMQNVLILSVRRGWIWLKLKETLNDLYVSWIFFLIFFLRARLNLRGNDKSLKDCFSCRQHRYSMLPAGNVFLPIRRYDAKMVPCVLICISITSYNNGIRQAKSKKNLLLHKEIYLKLQFFRKIWIIIDVVMIEKK